MASQVATELQRQAIDPHIQELVEMLFGTAVTDRIRVQGKHHQNPLQNHSVETQSIGGPKSDILCRENGGRVGNA